MPKAKRSHYYVVTGFILLRAGENSEISQLTLNSMVRSDIKNIPMRLLGRAQQALQMTLHQRMTEDGETPDYQVIDVVILNMLYCGFMTEAEFNATPDSELRELTVSGNDPFAQALPTVN